MSRAITAALLATVFTGFKTSFQGGLTSAQPLWSRVATRIPSTARTETYGWLGAWPRIREWLGDRQIKKLSAEKYQITNRDFESTIEVDRNDLTDDQLGIYGPMFRELGQATSEFPDQHVFDLLKNGHVGVCYDGQPFFDDEHPHGDDDVQSNVGGGGGTKWYLLQTKRALKPLIFQERQAFDFTALDKSTDANVFHRKSYIYGVDGRAAFGYGFWQMAAMSGQTLNAQYYGELRAQMMGLKNDEGGALNIMPDLLVVPPALEGAARRLMTADQIDGTTNEWKGTCEVLVVPWLA